MSYSVSGYNAIQEQQDAILAEISMKRMQIEAILEQPLPVIYEGGDVSLSSYTDAICSADAVIFSEGFGEQSSRFLLSGAFPDYKPALLALAGCFPETVISLPEQHLIQAVDVSVLSLMGALDFPILVDESLYLGSHLDPQVRPFLPSNYGALDSPPLLAEDTATMNHLTNVLGPLAAGVIMCQIHYTTLNDIFPLVPPYELMINSTYTYSHTLANTPSNCNKFISFNVTAGMYYSVTVSLYVVRFKQFRELELGLVFYTNTTTPGNESTGSDVTFHGERRNGYTPPWDGGNSEATGDAVSIEIPPRVFLANNSTVNMLLQGYYDFRIHPENLGGPFPDCRTVITLTQL